MKTLIALLILSLPLSAQTVTWSPTIGYEWQSLYNFPAGTFIVQYGCTGKWSPPFTFKGPLSNLSIDYRFVGLKADITGCPGAAGASGQPGAQVQLQSKAFNIGVRTWTGTVYGVAVTKTIPASTITPPPTSITIPANGTCTAIVNGVSTPCAFVINPSGNLTVTAGTLGVTVKP